MDPETIYAKIASGDPMRFTTLAEQTGDCSRSIDRDARAIVKAASSPSENGSWTGKARMSFEEKGLEAYLGAALSSLRLIRVSNVLDFLGDFYRGTQQQAELIITQWRQLPDDRSWFVKQIDRATFVNALDQLKAQYEEQLRKAVSEYLKVDEDFRNWVKQGAILDYVFYLEYDVLPAVRIPDTYINGKGGSWTPQGLTSDKNGNFLTTSYGESNGKPDGQSQMTIINGKTGEPSEPVPLRSDDGRSSPDHAGGTVVDGDKVYVVGGKTLHVYNLSDIREASRTGEPAVAIKSSEIPGSAYVTVSDDGQVYVGEDDKNAVWPIDVADDGSVSYDEDDYLSTPGHVNGLEINNGVFTYSTQQGRDNPAELVRVLPGEDPSDYHTISTDEIPNMSQNLTRVGDRVYGMSESGSALYDQPKEAGDSPLDLWGTTHIFEVPNSGAGYQVHTESLREGMRELRAAKAGLEGERNKIQGFDLPAPAVGDVDGGPAFASQLAKYFNDTLESTKAATYATDVSAEGLSTVADTYDDTDDSARERFRSAMDGML
ncbi:hypothetical protein GCM10023340_21870 [Nocardioides marinquilinus]|uniref:WXG100 family type VII secretion target n=1 Tax=Nocardioides marinquilinus TaxID=1210400 RepID=A0ABP9PKN9_9ACTN